MREINGTYVNYSGHTVTISYVDGEQADFLMTTECDITMNGNEATFRDLYRGDEVKLIGEPVSKIEAKN